LKTDTLTDGQWLIGAAPAVVLLFLWEAGKLIARRRAGPAQEVVPAAQ
jgi:hypothetical protein